MGDLIEVGYVAKPHGVRGELRVVTYDPESTTLEDAPQVHIDGRVYDLIAARPVNGAFLVSLAGVTDRNQTELLRGKIVAVAREHIPLEEGEILLADLVGCQAVREDGSPYGVIVAVELDTQDRLVIHDGDIERLLPLVPAFIAAIELEASRVVVTPPEGLPESRRTSR